MSDVVVLDSALVPMSTQDAMVFRFDWDTENLNPGVAIASQSVQVVGVHAMAMAIDSLTRSGSTATVTTSADHGRATGDVVTIAGADQSEYNITATITVTGARTFTYTISGTPTSPATGALTYSRGLDFDTSSLLSAAPYNSRSTRVRLLAKGPEFLGCRFRIANHIITDETPAQRKARSFTVVLETL